MYLEYPEYIDSPEKTEVPGIPGVPKIPNVPGTHVGLPGGVGGRDHPIMSLLPPSTALHTKPPWTSRSARRVSCLVTGTESDQEMSLLNLS